MILRGKRSKNMEQKKWSKAEIVNEQTMELNAKYLGRLQHEKVRNSD